MNTGDTGYCEICGTKFTYEWRGHKNVCSDDCAKIAKKYKRRQEYLNDKEKKLALLREMRVKQKKPYPSIGEVASLARKEGLTYGQYVRLHMV